MSQNLEKFGVEALFLTAKFEKGIQTYNLSLGRADKATSKFVQDSTRGFDRMDKAGAKASRGLIKSFTDIRSALQVAIGVLRAFGQVAAAAFRAAQEGAQQLRSQRAFANLTKDIGGSEEALGALRRATRGAASDQQLMEQGVTLLSLRVAKNTDELERAARSITNVAARIKGFTAERAIMSFTLLTTNFEASKARLDDFGLTLDDVKPKIEAYTRAGVESQEAIRLALLEAVEEKFQELGGAAEDAALSFEQLQAAQENFSDGVKQDLAPAGALIAEIFTKTFEQAEETGIGINNLELAAIKLAAAFAASTVVADQLAGRIEGLFGIVRDGFESVNIIDAATEMYNETLSRGIDLTESAGETLARTNEEAEEGASDWGELTQSIRQFNDAIEQAQVSALEALVQESIKAERQIEDAALARARKLEDIERDLARRREEITRAAADQRAEIESTFTDALAQAEQQAQDARRQATQAYNDRLLQIERQFNDAKRRINQEFALSFRDAVRRRDALALVEAVRTRKRELDEAKRERDQQRTDAQADYGRQLEEQNRALEQQREAARQARDQQLQDLQANLAEQEAELQRSAAQQLDDFNRSEERKRADQETAAQRRLDDLIMQFELARTQALAEYQNDEELYRQHLEKMLALSNAYIPRIFGTPGGGAQTFPPSAPPPPVPLAEGGAFVATGATPFVAGEAGPELVIAQPLSQIVGPASPVSASVGGQIQHQIQGAIRGEMMGFSGRLTAEMNRLIVQAFEAVLQ